MDSPIGVLKFASAGDRLVGDPGMEGTFTFPVCYGTVPGSYRDLIEGSQEACTHLCKAASGLEKQGACAIAGDCGLMALYQAELASSVSVPVAASSLSLLPLIGYMINSEKKIGIITGHSQLLGQRHLTAAGADMERLAIQGMESESHFAAVVLEGRERQDYEKMKRDVHSAVGRLLAKDQQVGAILLECSNLTTFAREVEKQFALPVFDINLAIEMLYRSQNHINYADKQQ